MTKNTTPEREGAMFTDVLFDADGEAVAKGLVYDTATVVYVGPTCAHMRGESGTSFNAYADWFVNRHQDVRVGLGNEPTAPRREVNYAPSNAEEAARATYYGG